MEGTRNEMNLRYDLIPGEVLDYIAERLAYGAAKFGDNNWKLGLPGDKSPVNHALAHLASYQKSRAENFGPLTPEEKNDLQAVLTNLAFEVYYREHPDVYTWENRRVVSETAGGQYPPAPEPYDLPPSDPYPQNTPTASTSNIPSENPFSRFFNFNK